MDKLHHAHGRRGRPTHGAHAAPVVTRDAENAEEASRLDRQFDEMRIDAWRSGEWNVNLEEDIVGEDGTIVVQPYVVVRPDEVSADAAKEGGRS